jgi:hypothetical protein
MSPHRWVRDVALTREATMSITEFLLARIAEDEAAARQASWSWSRPDRPDDPDPDHWETPPGTPTEIAGPMRNVAGADTATIATHIARHDPARVLAECAAKRAIVEWHCTSETDLGPAYPDHQPWCEACEGALFPCVTVRHLAAIYREHPDYDPSWAV